LNELFINILTQESIYNYQAITGLSRGVQDWRGVKKFFENFSKASINYRNFEKNFGDLLKIFRDF
jgi:hypothetical protein